MRALCRVVLLIAFLTSGVFSQAQHFYIQNIHIVGDLPKPIARRINKVLGLKKSSVLTPEKIEAAQNRLLHFINHKGYLWAHIDSTKLIPLHDSTKFELEFGIKIGPLFQVDTIWIVSDSLPPVAYRKGQQLKAHAPFDQDILSKDLKRMMDLAADQGYPFVKIKPQPQIDKATHEVSLKIRIQEGAKVFIKGIILQGNHYTKPQVALRALYFQPDMVFRQTWFKKIPKRLRNLNIFKSVDLPQMIRTAKDSVVIVIPVQEGNAANFDGVVGYVPQPSPSRFKNQKGYFTGLLNFSFQNLLGTGRKLKIFWEKSDRFSEHFNFGYLEPWLFNQPLDLGLNFAREVRDTLYLAYDLSLSANLHWNDNFALFLNFTRHSVLPDSFARSTLSLLKNRVYNLESGIRYDTRDYPLNPRKGIFYQSSYRFGLKRNFLLPGQKIDSLPKNLNLNTLSLTFEFYHEFLRNQVLALKVNGKRIRGSHLQISDYFWLGGSRSVRGYREKQFSGYLIGWANLEYRFLTGQNTRIFLFSDFGYYENAIVGQAAKKFLQGMGLGLRFGSPLGIMGIDFGFAKGEGFNQGKIHFGLTSRF